MNQQKISQKYQKLENQQDDQMNNNNEYCQKIGKTKSEIYKEGEQKLEKFVMYLKDKIVSLLWIIAAVIVIYESNFFFVIFDSPYINSFFMSIAGIMLGIYAGLNIYIGFVLPYYYNQHEDDPKLIQFTAFVLAIMFFSFLFAVWPVYGWKTIPIIFVIFFGYCSTASFLPGKYIGGIASILIFIGLFHTHHYIDHDGKWH